MYTGAGLKNEWAGNLNGQSFDDITFEDGITYTAILAATSGSSVASLGTATGLLYFSTLTASPATGTASLYTIIQPTYSSTASSAVILKRDPNKVFALNTVGGIELIKQPQRILAAVASNTVSVKRTALKTLKANATMVAWSFLHRCGISAFSQIYAERNWGATYHVTGWTMDASSNYSYSVRQGIYGCS